MNFKKIFIVGSSMYKIVVDYDPTQADNQIVSDGLFASYENIVGERDKYFSIFLKNDLENIFGGIQAAFDTQSIYIEMLWVEETLRKQGYGKKLLEAAEREAIKKGCIFST